MPDDPFADLGSGGKRSAADRLAERDEADLALERPERPPDAPKRSPYAWVVGVLFIVVAALLGSRLLGEGDGEAVRGPQPGRALAVFAAPLATGRLEGDANVKQDAGAPDSAGKRPACEVTGPDIVNLCQLRRRPLVLTFVVTRGADCEPQLEVLERARRDFPDVAFAAVVSGNDRSAVERIVRRRRLGFPVAVDRDGAVINLYGIGVCPATVFAQPGGKVRETRLGLVDLDGMRRSIRRIAR